MEWVSAIRRNGANGLCVEVQNEQGSRSLKELSALDANLHKHSDTKISLAVKLTDATRICATQYLTYLGLEHLDASCQTAYQFEIGKERFILPSQLLIMSIMGATLHLRNALFKPGSLDSFMTTFHDSSQLRNEVLPIRPDMNGCVTGKPCQKRLRWFSSFPSARIAWFSVYRNALEGRFDTTLPTAQGTMTLHCRQVKSRFVVTKVSLGTIEALEEPHDLMKNCAVARSVKYKVISNRFREPAQRKTATEHPIVELVPGLRLTDQQWERVESIIKKFIIPTPSNRDDIGGYPTRPLIDAMFVMLGKPFQRIDGIPLKTQHSASALLYRLQTSGLLDKLLEALREQSKISALPPC